MAYKFCPNCFSTSYSRVNHNIWLCPTCGKDLSVFDSTDSIVMPVNLDNRKSRNKHLQVISGGKI